MNELGFDKFYIELYETCPCVNKDQLLKKGGKIIRLLDTYKNGYNAKIAGRSKNEYNNENKDMLSIKSKDYYQTNKDDIFEESNRL